MEQNILEHYDINQSTMALLAASHTDYATIVLEPNRKLFVKKPALKLVQSSCLDGYSTYDGRRTAIIYHTGAKRKVPIPINPSKNIYAFPTHSPTEYCCNWIFYHHVKNIIPIRSSTDKVQSTIIFHDQQQLTMNESYFVLEKQMQRTAMCILLFSEHFIYTKRQKGI